MLNILIGRQCCPTKVLFTNYYNGIHMTKKLQFSNRLSPQLNHDSDNTLTKTSKRTNEPPAIVLPKNVSPKNIRQPTTFVISPTNTASIVNNNIVSAAEENKLTKVKKQEELPWQVTPAETDFSKLLNHYLMLSKFRLTSLVVITTMAGYAMAPAPFELSSFVLCSVGTGLCSAAANSINQYHEVPFDAQMSRTRNRVLVRGLVTPLHAIGFGVGAATTGICMLYYGLNGMTALLGAGNLLLYTCIYTPMKRYSILNTWVGSIVGAIPPIMGWVGCSGTIDAGAWILAGLLYAWQFPHFNALSWNLRPDYSRAGYRMMCVTNPALCRRTALRYTAVIMGLSLAAPMFDVTNIWFAVETLPLNAYFAYLAYKFYKKSDSNSSRTLFRFSLVHLPILMALFLLNKKHWIFMEKSAEEKLLTTTAAVTDALTENILSTPAQTPSQLIATNSSSTTHSLSSLESEQQQELKAIQALQKLWQ